MLHECQRDFVAAALKNEKAALIGHVQSPHGALERRLGVYYSNTINSLNDVLMAAFPVVLAIVGERFFRVMAREFVQVHPPKRPTLFRYGETLPSFLSTFSPGKTMPYLPDVARLEWARIEAYFAVDCVSIDSCKLASVAPEYLHALTLSLHPSVQLIRSTYPIFRIWDVNQDRHDTITNINLSQTECGLVFREGHSVIQRLLGRDSFQWLKQISIGRTFGQATESTVSEFPEFDLQDTLHLLLASGVFTNISVKRA